MSLSLQLQLYTVVARCVSLKSCQVLFIPAKHHFMQDSAPTWEPQDDPQKVISPFEQTQTSPVQPTKNSRVFPWLIVACVFVALAVGTWVAFSYLNDPYRTLESFPVGKYYESYRSLAGSKFKGELTVVANLGWRPEEGKLMVFQLDGDPRPVAILVAPEEASIAFQKGQTYLAELNVQEGGLIYAHSFQKD